MAWNHKIALIAIAVAFSSCGLSNNGELRQRTSDSGKVAVKSGDVEAATVEFSSAELPAMTSATAAHDDKSGKHSYRFQFRDKAGAAAIIIDVQADEALVPGKTYAYRSAPKPGEATLPVGSYKVVKTADNTASDVVGDIVVTPLENGAFRIEASGISRDSESFSLTAPSVAALEFPTP